MPSSPFPAALAIATALALIGPCVGHAQTGGEARPEPVPFDANAAPETRTEIVPGLTVGGDFELEYEGRRFEYRGIGADHRSVLQPELSLAATYQLNPMFRVFVELEIRGEIDAEAGSGGYRGTQGQLKEIFARLDSEWGGRIVAGRQRYNDHRQWLWDEQLDGVEISYRTERFKFEASVTRRDALPLDFFEDRADDLTNNYFVGASWEVSKEIDLDAYVLVRDDLTDRRDSPVQLGIHADGDLTRQVEFSFDAAAALGRDREQTMRGFGFDASATYEFTRRGRQSVTGAFAFGTGDRDQDDRTDGSFRQSGLQDNEDKFNGVTRFKYYGELFDPELSNMSIFTLGYGFRPSKRSSVDLVGHYYLQHVALPEIRDSNFRVDPTGLSSRLGGEIDLIVGFREWKDVDVEMVAAVFFPDDALAPNLETSYFGGLQVQVSF